LSAHGLFSKLLPIMVCLSRSSLAAAAAVALCTGAGAQSLFGHPAFASNDFWGAREFGGPYMDARGLGSYPYGSRYNELPPCPRYSPVASSGWQETADGRLAVQILLPGVRQGDRRAWLSADGGEVRVRGVRALPARGRACLPHGARVAADGRHEVLEMAISLPEDSDTASATVRDIGDSLVILIPRRVPKRARDPYEEMAGSGDPEEAADAARAPTVRSPPGQLGEGMEWARQKSSVSATAAETGPALPRGVEIVDGWEDEDVMEPEVECEGAEGWWDNRGEFNFY